MAIEFEVHEFMAVPPEEVYRALTDLDGAADWMPGLIRVEKLSEGGFAPGFQWRETRKMFGKEATEQFEVTDCDPPRKIALRVDGTKGTSGRGEYLFEFRLQPDQGGTRVYMGGTIQDTGVVGTLLGWLLVFPYKKACAKDLRALKDHLEGGGEG